MIVLKMYSILLSSVSEYAYFHWRQLINTDFSFRGLQLQCTCSIMFLSNFLCMRFQKCSGCHFAFEKNFQANLTSTAVISFFNTKVMLFLHSMQSIINLNDLFISHHEKLSFFNNIIFISFYRLLMRYNTHIESRLIISLQLD